MAEEDQGKKKAINPKTYQVRKECIKRKSMELATLCDIKVCTIISGPKGELQTWPENLDAVKEVVDLYSKNLKPKRKDNESSKPVPVPAPAPQAAEEEEGEEDLLTLLETKIDAVNKRIRFIENRDDVGKGKKPRIE